MMRQSISDNRQQEKLFCKLFFDRRGEAYFDIQSRALYNSLCLSVCPSVRNHFFIAFSVLFKTFFKLRSLKLHFMRECTEITRLMAIAALFSFAVACTFERQTKPQSHHRDAQTPPITVYCGSDDLIKNRRNLFEKKRKTKVRYEVGRA